MCIRGNDPLGWLYELPLFPCSIQLITTALTANLMLDYNYMFLMRGDGTPYDIIYNLVGGNPVIYPIMVVLLFVIYIVAFEAIYNYFANKSKQNAEKEEKQEVTV